MNLREGERIERIYHHHPTPFIVNILKAVTGAFPFFLLLFFFKEALGTKYYFLANLVVFALFSLVIVYLSLIYWLDKLVVTNYRIVHIDWKYLTVREEAEALLDDVEDITTKEKGILSSLYIFDYGTFKLTTASAKITLIFYDAPDPEGIRRFVYHLKPQ